MKVDGLIIEDSLLIWTTSNSLDTRIIFLIVGSDLKSDKKSTYTLMLVTGTNISLYVISGFCVSKNKLNSFGLILNLMVSSFKFIFCPWSVFLVINLLNLFVSTPIVDNIKIKVRSDIITNKIRLVTIFFIFYF